MVGLVMLCRRYGVNLSALGIGVDFLQVGSPGLLRCFIYNAGTDVPAHCPSQATPTY
jgi:hypothetical protein